MIPLATRTVTVWNPSTVDDGEDALTWSQAAAGIRAHISGPAGSVTGSADSAAVEIDGILLCDPTPALTDQSVVEDSATGAFHAVDWVAQVSDVLGTGHVRAGIHVRAGVVAG